MTVGAIPAVAAVAPLSGASALRSNALPAVPAVVAAGSSEAAAAQLLALSETAALEASLPIAAPLPPVAPTLNAAAQAAAVSQGGLAPLMADLSQALRIPGLPAPVQAASAQLLALRAPLDAQPTPADIKAALARPGLSPQAQVAPAALPSGASAAAPLFPSSADIKGALLGLQQALTTWLDGAQAPPPPSASAVAPPAGTARQDASASRTANSPPLPSGSAAPAPVPSATGRLPASPTPSASTLVGGGRESVLPQSGTSPGAALALPPGPPAAQEAGSLAPTPAPAVNGEVVSALPQSAAAPEAALALPAVPEEAGSLAPTLAPPGAAPSPVGQLAPVTVPVEPEALPAAAVAVVPLVAALPAAADVTGALQVFQQVFKSLFDSAATASTPLPPTGEAEPERPPGPPLAPSTANTPPPPYRGGPTSAEAAVASTLPLTANPLAVGDRLLHETNAALAHQELLAIASLPTTAATSAGAAPKTTPAPAHNGGQGPEWMVEIPFATPQGSAIAQLKISRDSGKATTAGQATMWRARFSLDIEPMGPVHAQIALSGERTWVSLWAERAEGLTRLRGHEGLLTKALSDADFVPEIAIHAGAPHQPAVPTGKFLDRES